LPIVIFQQPAPKVRKSQHCVGFHNYTFCESRQQAVCGILNPTIQDLDGFGPDHGLKPVKQIACGDELQGRLLDNAHHHGVGMRYLVACHGHQSSNRPCGGRRGRHLRLSSFGATAACFPLRNDARAAPVSKQGDRYLQRLLVLGATAVIRHARTKAIAETAWLRGVLDRRPVRLASVAQANKTARIVWAPLARGETYRAPAAAQAAAA
jgi:hypothetical protein